MQQRLVRLHNPGVLTSEAASQVEVAAPPAPCLYPVVLFHKCANHALVLSTHAVYADQQSCQGFRLPCIASIGLIFGFLLHVTMV